MHSCYLLWHAIFFCCCISWKLALSLILTFLLCAGLWCVYFPTSRDEWLNQKWRSDGTEMIFILWFLCHNVSFTCQLFVFSSLDFVPHRIYLVSLALVCLALNTFRRGFGRAKYYTRPSLPFCQPSLAYSNITPTVSRQSRITYRKLIFLKESSLFLLSALIDLNRSNHWSLPHTNQNTYFIFTSVIFVLCW